MEINSLARRAGMVGMAGAVMWIFSVLLEYTFSLNPPDGSGPLYVFNQILALAALVAIAVGLLGILWGGGVTGKIGRSGVWLFVIGYGLIVIGGIAALVVRSDDSPLFLVFPIGGLLMDLGALITGISVAHAKQWGGWQRWMPLVYAAYLWLAIEIPFIIGVYPDGPGMVPEIFQGAGLFLVALAVYTARSHVSAASLSTA